MASHVVVIHTSLRKAIVKVTPQTFMTEIVEDACKQLRLPDTNYDLKYKNKVVDLAGTFRHSNITAGSRLELIVASRSPAPVSVALQVPESLNLHDNRLKAEFSSNTTLWDILRAFENGAPAGKLDLTRRPDTDFLKSGEVSKPQAVMYLQPVLDILNRDVSTSEELARTLSNYGVNGGSILIRLTFKPTQRIWGAALEENDKYFRSIASNDGTVEAGSVTTEAPIAPLNSVDNGAKSSFHEVPSSAPTPEAPEPISAAAPAPFAPSPASGSQENSLQVSSAQEALVSRSGRPVTVYKSPSSDTPKAALLPHNVMDYEPSVTMVQATHSRLQASSQNKQLPSDAEIERLDQEKAAKLATIQEITIKMQFPDNSTVVFSYTADSSCNDLYQDAKDVIVAENEPFKLQARIKTNKVEVIPRSEKKLIKGMGFSGRSVAQFVWETDVTEEGKKHPSLKAHYRAVAKEIPVVLPTPEDESKEDGASNGGKKDGDVGGKGSGNKMGKFFPGLRNLNK